MWKAISAISAAALIAGSISLIPGFSPEAAATAPDLSAKTDRADMPQSCPEQGWPYYKASCLHDGSRNAGRMLKVRIVSTDRIPQANPHTDFDLAPQWPLMVAQLQVAVPGWALGGK
jgi:hypothetical protein